MEFSELVSGIGHADADIRKKAEERWLMIAKPLFALGRLEDAVSKIAAIKGTLEFSLKKKAIIVMCADNGIVEEGVTQTGQEMTAAVSENFTKGRACVSIMAKRAEADVFPVDIGIKTDISGLTDKRYKIAYGTKNFAKESAMTRKQAERAILVGAKKVFELKEKGYEIIGTGEMGIGNTSTSSAVLSLLLDEPPEKLTGCGAGLSGEGLKRKIRAIKKGIEVNSPNREDALDVLSKVGGLDIAGLVGVFLGGAYYRVPVAVDGLISLAAALLAAEINETAKEYMLASHVSKEPAAILAIEKLGLLPIVDAGMFVGEGTGVCTLFPIIDMAYDVFRYMDTFSEGNYTDEYKVYGKP